MPSTSSIGPTTVWLETLTRNQRLACVFLREYEIARRKTQYGYNAKIPVNDAGLDDPVFKQAVRVVEVLADNRLFVRADSIHWKGLVRHVFERMQPTVPQPGHFCNRLHIAEYCSGKFADLGLKPERTVDDMRLIYLRVLDPQLKPLVKSILSGIV